MRSGSGALSTTGTSLGIPNVMDLYKEQDLVLECVNWRSAEREQMQKDDKL